MRLKEELNMSCNENKTITLIQGEYRTISLRIENEDGSSYSLNSPEEIIVKFPKSDRTALEKKLSLGEITIISDPKGEITLDLTEEDTNSLKLGELQDFVVVIIKDSKPRKALFENKLTVKEILF